MTKPEELLALGDRCEREEASPYLASAILVALGHQTLFRGLNLGWEWRPEGKGIWRSMPRPDTSLDAAVTLVPEDHCWSVSRRTHDRLSSANVYKPTPLRGFGVTPTHSEHSPALALCAAALRARAALIADGAEPDKTKVRTK